MKQIPTMSERAGDRGIDRLLRNQIGRRSKATGECAAFDPDLAGAYAERALTAAETARYETHLGECAFCRRAVTVLFNTAVPGAVAEPRRAVAAGADRGAGAFLGRVFGALLTPQWGLATAAVIVLAIALPILLSNKLSEKSGGQFIASEAQQGQAKVTTPADAEREASTAGLPAASREMGESPDQQKAARSQRLAGEGHAAAGGGGVATGFAGPAPETPAAAAPVDKVAEASAPVPGSTVARAEPGAKKEAKNESDAAAGQKREQAASASDAAQPTPPPPATEQLAKIDERQAQRLPPRDQDSARVTVLKQGRGDAEQSETKDAKIRPEDAVPPPTPGTSGGARARQSLRRSAPKLAMTDSASSAEAAKANKSLPEKKLNSKRFWLRDDIWTDKDYNPLKQMPVVTIVRDSEVYREVLNKRSGLKPYFMLFSESDRAIIVYKGTVYKLIPQNGK